MGEDDELVCWIQCNYCNSWCHGACVELKFTDDSAEGIVKFKCPECRKNCCLNDGSCDDSDEIVKENAELSRKVDKLGILVDQERGEVENLKQKEREQIRKSNEEKLLYNKEISSLKQQLSELRKEKNQATSLTKQTKSTTSGQITQLKNEISGLKQEKITEEKRMVMLKNTSQKQADTIDLQNQKLASLEKVVADNKASGVSKERIVELEASIEKRENLYNSVLPNFHLLRKNYKLASRN